MQEALVSHGGTKAEAAAAEQLFKSLAIQPEDPDKAKAANTAILTSPRDANASVAPESEAASSAASSVAVAKDGGAVSARAAMAATTKLGGVAGMTASPREVVDYDMFEQLWMADLTAPAPK